MVPLISFLERLEYIYTTRQGGRRLYFSITLYLFYSAADSKGHYCYSPCVWPDLLLGFLNQIRRSEEHTIVPGLKAHHKQSDSDYFQGMTHPSLLPRAE